MSKYIREGEINSIEKMEIYTWSARFLFPPSGEINVSERDMTDVIILIKRRNADELIFFFS